MGVNRRVLRRLGADSLQLGFLLEPWERRGATGKQ
jgi:hypothetical protein